MDYDLNILRLAEAFAEHNGMALSTVSRHASKSGATFMRIRAGKGITLARSRAILQWLSDHWPLELEWPADIPRPDPNPDATCFSGARPGPGAGPSSSNSAIRRTTPARARPLLNESGEVDNVAGFARGQGFNPRNVRNTLKRYGAGGPKWGHMPAPDTEAYLIMEALFEAGDARVQLSKMGYQAEKMGRRLGL